MFYFVFLYRKANTAYNWSPGAKGYVAENTIPSVNYAIDLGANGVEIDVFRCKSGEIVVFHDNNLSKILDVNLCIEDLDLKK